MAIDPYAKRGGVLGATPARAAEFRHQPGFRQAEEAKTL
jgi:hypothetical protein